MNKKLRLLVTAKCHNKCPMCCNNQFDFEEIPVVDRLDYDEISIMFQVVVASTRPGCIHTPWLHPHALVASTRPERAEAPSPG